MNLKKQIRTIEKRMRQVLPVSNREDKLSEELKKWTEEELRLVADGGTIPEQLAKRLEAAGIEYDQPDQTD